MAGPSTRLNVRRLALRDAWQAGYVLAVSQVDDPTFRLSLPDRRQRERVIRPYLAAVAFDVVRRGYGFQARIRGLTVGAALWLPPGTPPRTSWDSVRHQLALAPAIWAGRTRFAALARVAAALEREAATEDGWYLRALGVHPRQQGRGIDARLLAPILEAADSHGVTCGLHTSDPANVAFYERFGFVVIDPPHSVTTGGPEFLRMRRQPWSTA